MGLGTVDILLLVLSILVTAAIGIYQGVIGLEGTPKDYMLGGKTMHPIPLAMSMTVGTVSAISIMANAGEMYFHGTQLWMMDLGIAVGLVVVAKVLMPIFYPMQMVSLYQYFEERYKTKVVRRFAVLMTMTQAYLFIGFLLYPPTIFLKYATGLNTYISLIIIGVSSTVYSSFGGVKGVVYTDSFQSIIMIIGVLATVILAGSSVGGIAKAWDIAYHQNRIELFNFSLDPYQRHSFWLVIVYGFFFALSTYGMSQSQVQRAFSTGSVRDSQLVYYYAAVGMVVLRGLIHLSGVMVFAFYADCDPLGISEAPMSPVTIISTFVLRELTSYPGMAGLFVASIYAAVFSSVSTQVNSLTALVWEDFLKTLPIFAGWDDIKVTKLQRVLVCIAGVIGMFSGFIASNLLNFLQGLLSITGAIAGPIVGVFLVAIYIPWVRWKAVSIGYVSALIVNLWIVIGQILTMKKIKPLPFSYDGCQGNYTIYHNSSSIEPYRGEGLYGMSYCLNYCWGLLTCILTALTASLFLESNTPETVTEKLISPMAWRYFKKVSVLRRSSNNYIISLFHCWPFKKYVITDADTALRVSTSTENGEILSEADGKLSSNPATDNVEIKMNDFTKY